MLDRFVRHATELDAKGGSLADNAVDCNNSSHLDDEIATDRQPQSGALKRGRGQAAVHLDERIENDTEFFGGNSSSRVNDANARVRVVRIRGDGDHAARVGELDRVGNEVAQHLLHALHVATYGERRITWDIPIRNALR